MTISATSPFSIDRRGAKVAPTSCPGAGFRPLVILPAKRLQGRGQRGAIEDKDGAVTVDAPNSLQSGPDAERAPRSPTISTNVA